MKPRWILLRGLARGNGHWGDFPAKLKLQSPDIELEMIEIPGNGTRHQELTPIDPLRAILKVREKSQFVKESTPFNLCGVSLGGMIALKWAEIFPKEVASVSAINSSLAQSSAFFERLTPPNYPTILASMFTKDSRWREELILKMISNNSERSKLFLEDFAAFSEKNPLRRANVIRQIILASRIKVGADFPMPVKIICSEGDQFVSPQCSVNLAKKLRVLPLVHPSAGHDIPLDEPEWLCQKILT
jgi:pimeloyl-ACP methyl ester carboxylesterase